MENAFQDLKLLFCLNIKNTLPARTDRLELTIDASHTCLAGNLFLLRISASGDYELVLVGAMSKNFGDHDLRKNIFVKELLALFYSVKYFESLIDDSIHALTILVDCRSLIALNRMKQTNNRLHQVNAYLSQRPKGFLVLHIPSHYNFLADLFSCSYNNIHPEVQATISTQWAQLLPPLPNPSLSTPVLITQEQFNHYLHLTPSPEILDIGTKQRLCTPATSAANILKQGFTTAPELNILVFQRMINMFNDDTLTTSPVYKELLQLCLDYLVKQRSKTRFNFSRSQIFAKLNDFLKSPKISGLFDQLRPAQPIPPPPATISFLACPPIISSSANKFSSFPTSQLPPSTLSHLLHKLDSPLPHPINSIFPGLILFYVDLFHIDHAKQIRDLLTGLQLEDPSTNYTSLQQTFIYVSRHFYHLTHLLQCLLEPLSTSTPLSSSPPPSSSPPSIQPFHTFHSVVNSIHLYVCSQDPLSLFYTISVIPSDLSPASGSHHPCPS